MHNNTMKPMVGVAVELDGCLVLRPPPMLEFRMHAKTVVVNNAPWHAQRLLTQRRGDTAVAPALGASAQGVPAPSGFLVLKTLTESTAPARPVPPPQAEDTGPSGAQVASAHCAGRPVLV